MKNKLKNGLKEGLGKSGKFTRKRLLITAAALAILGFAAISIYNQTRPAKVAVVLPKQVTIEETVLETGSIGYENSLTVYAERSGKVATVLKETGDGVVFGEVLVKLDGSANELLLKDAEAKIAAAKAQLDGAKTANYANELDSLSLQVSEAKRQKALAESYLNDAKNLYDSGAASQAEYKAAKDQFDRLDTQLKSLEMSYSQLSKGSPAYQKRLSQAQLDQALIYRDQLLLEQSLLEMAAPLKGIVLERFVEPSAFIQAGSPVMVIGDPSAVEVTVDILADEIGGLSLGDSVRMTAAYLPGESISGKVSKIAPSAKEVASSLGILQKRLPVTIEVTSHQAELRPGLPVEVTIIKNAKANALCVPVMAVMEDSTGYYVLVADKGQAVRRDVTLGLKSDQWWEVLSGLTVEDVVIDDSENPVGLGQKIIFEL